MVSLSLAGQTTAKSVWPVRLGLPTDKNNKVHGKHARYRPIDEKTLVA